MENNAAICNVLPRLKTIRTSEIADTIFDHLNQDNSDGQQYG